MNGYNMIYKKSWKYILKHYHGPLNRVKAVKDSPYIKKGTLGGFIRGYHNLSQKGDCWVYDRAWVCEGARISENAVVCENAFVAGNAEVTGYAVIRDNARVFDNAQVSGHAIVKGDMVVKGKTYLSD